VGEQPEQQTLMEFRAPAAEAERLAKSLADCLRPSVGVPEPRLDWDD
jgi:hypothetical protein